VGCRDSESVVSASCGVKEFEIMRGWGSDGFYLWGSGAPIFVNAGRERFEGFRLWG
jgi:hypothetical protein